MGGYRIEVGIVLGNLVILMIGQSVTLAPAHGIRTDHPSFLAQGISQGIEVMGVTGKTVGAENGLLAVDFPPVLVGHLVKTF